MRGIVGYCPVCGRDELTIRRQPQSIDSEWEIYEIFCSFPACPRPTAAHEILQDPEIHHIVRFDRATFNVQHPLRERIDGNLLDCEIHKEVRQWTDGWSPRGTWRVKWTGLDGYRWESIST